jgi:hypothetical protein
MSKRRSKTERFSPFGQASEALAPGTNNNSAARELTLQPALRPIQHAARRTTGKSSSHIRYKTLFKTTIGDVLRARGWKEADSDLDWDMIWADSSWIREV